MYLFRLVRCTVELATKLDERYVIIIPISPSRLPFSLSPIVTNRLIEIDECAVKVLILFNNE